MHTDVFPVRTPPTIRTPRVEASLGTDGHVASRAPSGCAGDMRVTEDQHERRSVLRLRAARSGRREPVTGRWATIARTETRSEAARNDVVNQNVAQPLREPVEDLWIPQRDDLEEDIVEGGGYTETPPGAERG
jgi:hypothetical protein